MGFRNALTLSAKNRQGTDPDAVVFNHDQAAKDQPAGKTWKISYEQFGLAVRAACYSSPK